MASRSTKAKPHIGWREWVILPEMSSTPLKAKIDTGARTSALHAFDLTVQERGGEPWVEFVVHPVQRSTVDAKRVAYPIQGYRKVRSSTGHSELRPVIRTTVVIGGRRFAIDVTLTARDEMGFRMLLGRAALRRRFLVDAGRSYLHPLPTNPDENEARENAP